jgi:hypothetical protein
VLDELVAKKDRTDLVEMTAGQHRAYDDSLAVHKGASASAILRKAKNIFTELRKMANHPLLCRVRYTDPATIQALCRHFYRSGMCVVDVYWCAHACQRQRSQRSSPCASSAFVSPFSSSSRVVLLASFCLVSSRVAFVSSRLVSSCFASTRRVP